MEIETAARGPQFPREYRPSLKWKILLYASGLLFFFCGIGICATIHWNGRDPRVHLIGIGMLLVGVYFTLNIWLVKLVLTEESFEVSDLFTRSVVHRSDYKGRRTVPVQYFDAIILIPHHGTKNFSLPLLFELDDVFLQWLLPIPDIAQADRERETAELLLKIDAELPVDEAVAVLDSVRTTAQILNGIGAAVTLWLYFYPYPYVPVVAAAALMPVVALAFVSYHGGIVVLNGGQRSPYPQVGVAWILPMLVLAWRGGQDIHVVDLSASIFIGALVGALFLLLSWMVDASLKRLSVGEQFCLAAFTFLYGFGLTALGNSLCDTGRPAAHQVRVLRVQEHRGSKYHYFEVGLAPWGPMTDPHSIHVDEELFRQRHLADEVTVDLYLGAFGIRWFTVHK